MRLLKLIPSGVTIARRKEEVHITNSALSRIVLFVLWNMKYFDGG